MLWTFPVSILGLSWRSMQRPLYSFLALVLLLSGLSVWWLAGWLRKEYRSRPNLHTTKPTPIAMPSIIPKEARTKHIRMMLGLLMGVALGWLWRDHQLATNIVPYTDVSIHHRLDDRHFIVQPARMPELAVTLCNGDRVDWLPGDHLRDWIFEQMQGCKRNISYHKGGDLDAGL